MLAKTMFAILLIFISLTDYAWSQQATTKKNEITVVIVDFVPTGKVAMAKPYPYDSEGYYQHIQKKFPTDALAKKFNEFINEIGNVFKGTPKALGDLRLNEIELNLQINAEGGFDLIGKATVGMTTGIKVTLKKMP